MPEDAPSAGHYRNEAQRALALAAESSTPEIRTALVEIAEHYVRLAEFTETQIPQSRKAH